MTYSWEIDDILDTPYTMNMISWPKEAHVILSHNIKAIIL